MTELQEEMKNISYNNMLTEGGHSLNSTLIACWWNERFHPCSDIFTETLADNHGLCFTFNKDGSYVSSQVGKSYGLDVFINVQQELYSHYSLSSAAGMSVLVHEPEVMPVFQTRSLSLAPGVFAEMMLTRKEVK